MLLHCCATLGCNCHTAIRSVVNLHTFRWERVDVAYVSWVRLLFRWCTLWCSQSRGNVAKQHAGPTHAVALKSALSRPTQSWSLRLTDRLTALSLRLLLLLLLLQRRRIFSFARADSSRCHNSDSHSFPVLIYRHLQRRLCSRSTAAFGLDALLD